MVVALGEEDVKGEARRREGTVGPMLVMQCVFGFVDECVGLCSRRTLGVGVFLFVLF